MHSRAFSCATLQMAQLVVVVLLAVFPAVLSASRNDLLNISENANNMEEACKFLGPFLPIPVIQSEDFCATSGFINDKSMCPFLDLTEKSLTHLSGGSSNSTCLASSQSPAASTSLQGAHLPYPLADLRPLPNALPNRLLAREGASYYWLWKNVLNFERWSGCAATNTSQTVTTGIPSTGDASRDFLVPPGWTVYSTIWLPDGSAAVGLYWPFVTIMYKADSIVILVRGTETLEDWKIDFDYTQVTPWAELCLPGKIHTGFATVVASIWRPLRSALHSLVTHRSSGTRIKNVYVSGHSLGAGVATLLAYTAQEYLGDRLKVDATLFAAPNVGNDVFAAAYRQKVNGRRIRFLNDLIPQAPCTPTMIGCKNALVPTNTSRNNGLWSYTSVAGNLVLQPNNMPQQTDAWSRLSKIYPCEAGRFLRATHTCSYNCYLTQYVADDNNLCQLWAVPAGSTPAGSYCYDFPVTEGPRYPYEL